MAGETVTFTASNGGSASPASGNSGTDGRLSTTWTLGSAAGAQTLTATVGGFQVIASATATAPIVLSTPTLTATTISTTQINLSWTNVASETGYRIERCSGASCSSFALLNLPGADVTTYSNTGLTANTFTYRVRAENASSVGSYSAVATANTLVPAAPTLTATALSTTAISLSWTDLTGETGYVLERCSGVACSSFATIVNPLVNASSYTNSVSANTSYSYRLRGVNGPIVGANSAPATVNTNVPAAPVLYARPTSTASNVLTWPDIANESVYDVYYCTGAGCTPNTVVATPTAGTESYTHTGLTGETVYRYRVRGRNGNITGTNSNTFEVQTISLQPNGACNIAACATTISAAGGAYQWYYVDIPAGSDSLAVQLKPGTGDADLYVAKDAYPQGTGAGVYSSAVGSNQFERVSIPNPAAGRWYILVIAYTSFAGWEIHNSPIKLVNEPSFEQLGAWSFQGSSTRLSGAARTGIVAGNVGVNSSGVAVNSDGYFYQNVKVPSAVGTVTTEFYYFTVTDEPNVGIPYDYVNVRVYSADGTLLATLLSLSNTNRTTLYTRAAVDLTPWRGQTIRLSFEGDNDGAYPTQFRIDDVKMYWNTVR